MCPNDMETISEAGASPSPGAQLRVAREAKSLTLADVAEQLHLSKQQIVELENDDYSQMSALIYGRGRLRMYAQFLGLPMHEILKAFDALGISEKENPPPLPLLQSKRIFETTDSSLLKRWWNYLAVLVLVILASILWLAHKIENRHHVAKAASATATTTNKPVAPTVINKPTPAANVTQASPVSPQPEVGKNPIPLVIPPEPANTENTNASSPADDASKNEPVPNGPDNGQD